MSSTHLQYAIKRDDGTVISRLGSEVAWPILDYEKIGEGGDYRAPLEYNLEKIPVLSVGREWGLLVWTRFVPTEMKNKHRTFWGLTPLPVEPPARDLRELLARHKTRFYYLKRPEHVRFGHPPTPRLVGIYHGTWGSSVGLYHWFTKTRRGYVFVAVSDNTDDDHKGAEKREVAGRRPARV